MARGKDVSKRRTFTDLPERAKAYHTSLAYAQERKFFVG